ncbi:MAG: hypothetical protein AAFO78_14515, partial [Pseudomonadota bacterium]
ISLEALANYSEIFRDVAIYERFSGESLTYTAIGNSELLAAGGANAAGNGPGGTTGDIATSYDLALPSDANVQAVYLYWHVMTSNPAKSFNTVVPISETAPFTLPDGTEVTVTGTRSFEGDIPANGFNINPTYEGRFADVTDLVKGQADPNGTYTVDVQGGASATAAPFSQENARSWQMIVVYDSPSTVTGDNQVYIYDGLQGFLGGTTQIAVDGYSVPTDETDARMSVLSVQGDSGIAGETLTNDDPSFPGFPNDWANSGGANNVNGTAGAFDIDTVTGDLTAGSTNMTLTLGTSGDLILATAVALEISTLIPRLNQQVHDTAFAEGESPVLVTDGVTDIDARGENDIVSLNITVGGLTDGAAETLIVDDGGTSPVIDLSQPLAAPIATTFGGTTFDINYDGTEITVANNAGATTPVDEADLEALLAALKYENTTPDVTVGDRTFDISVTDATENTSLLLASTVAVVNAETPVIDLDDDAAGADDPQYRTVIGTGAAPEGITDGSGTLSDIDDTGYAELSVQLGSGFSDGSAEVFVIGGETIALDGSAVPTTLTVGGNTFDVAFADDTLTFTQNGGGEMLDADAEALLNGIQYQNQAGANATLGDRTFDVTVTDSDNQSRSTTATIEVILDTDGDRVGDSIDIDDDNDGILDTTERTNWEQSVSTATLQLVEYGQSDGTLAATRTFTSL